MDRVRYKVETAELGKLKDYHFSVIFARYNEKWLYCRQKGSDDYGNAGGHIEEGESALEAAKRELYEETGALSYDIEGAFDYSTYSNEYGLKNGQIFFAQIHELGKLPDFEMEEVKLYDSIPEKLRFPDILPILYSAMQEWLIKKTGNPK